MSADTPYSETLWGFGLLLACVVVLAYPNDASALVPPENCAELHFTIHSVTINNGLPLMSFTATNEGGQGVLLTGDDVASGALRFGIAKLVPGRNGDADSWQSYINTIEVPNPGVGPDGSPVLPSAMQATTETRNTGGILTNDGNGNYRYRYRTTVTDPGQTMGVSFGPSLTHRVAMQVEFESQVGGELIANPTFDFVPDGEPFRTTKLVAKTESCNECHNRLTMHGARIEVKYCVTCHNPGTSDANSGNNLDFVRMVHKIHRGEELTNLPYVIWGFRDSEHDYSTVVYPQDIRNCTKCHTAEDEETPDGDNWKIRPTQQACGACHDDVDFSNHPDEGTVQADNIRCIVCHGPDGSLAAENVHRIFGQRTAEKYRNNILTVNHNPANGSVAVRFSVTDPTNGDLPYDILNDPEFNVFEGGASRLAILIGWDTVDYNNAESGSAAGQPISINPLTNSTTPARDNGDGTFSASAVLPPQAAGSGIVAIEGHPAVGGERIPVANAFKYFPITDGQAKPRREVVALAKCNECHGNLSLHGNNRQGAVEVCVICHNPNATDIDMRPATSDDFSDFQAVGVDGKREEAIHFKRMIHAIHAGKAEEHGFRENGLVVYGFGRSVNDFSEVRFPGILSDCTTCHVNESYRLLGANNDLASTVQTASPGLSSPQDIEAALENPADDLNISRKAAVCSSCHDSDEAQVHMEFDGGAVFDRTQSFISTRVFEECDSCHGPGEFMDVDLVHGIR
jgi:OmcA/MtrC family decaheme c-type cytochrome